MDQKETWLAQRRKCITATDVAKILGLAPWGSPHSVWRDKLGREEDGPPSPAMRLGVEMEPRIVDDYVSRHDGVELIDPGRYQLVTHPQHPWIACTPDRVYADRSCGLECKYVLGSQRYWSEEKPANHAFLQAHWCMIAMQIPRWDIAAWVGNRYYEYNLVANAELHKTLVDQCQAYLDRYILGDEEPDLDGSPQTSAYLSNLFEDITEEMLVPPEAVTVDARRYRDILAEERDLKTEKEHLKQGFAQKIGDATGFESEEFVLTYRRTKPSQKIDIRTFVASVEDVLGQDKTADLVQRHSTETPGTRRIALKFREDING